MTATNRTVTVLHTKHWMGSSSSKNITHHLLMLHEITSQSLPILPHMWQIWTGTWVWQYPTISLIPTWVRDYPASTSVHSQQICYTHHRHTQKHPLTDRFCSCTSKSFVSTYVGGSWPFNFDFQPSRVSSSALNLSSRSFDHLVQHSTQLGGVPYSL